ncbi:MAG: type II secretion system F family protein [Actinomycetota bacterium]
MLASLLAGAVAGAGIWAVARGLRPPVRLEEELARILGQPTPPQSSSPAVPSVIAERFARWAPSSDWWPFVRTLDADLAITERTPEAHTGRCLLAAGCLLAMAVCSAFVLAMAGIEVPTLVVAAAVLASAPAGIALAVLATRSEAAGRREELRRTIATFLELTGLTLAAGAGVESALLTAAAAGEGWTWERIREALRPSQVTGASPWEALGRLGEDLGVVELVELGSAVALATTSGSRLRETLAARAASQRSRELAREQANAAAATERMTFPVVAMALGFLILVGFPAVARVLGAH